VILSSASHAAAPVACTWVILRLGGFIGGLAELSLNHFEAEARCSQIERCLIPPSATHDLSLQAQLLLIVAAFDPRNPGLSSFRPGAGSFEIN